MESMIHDITIIGGGPVGLFSGAVAGEMGASCNVLESRCQMGGIMMAVYPDKDVYNFPGVPVIRGRDLIHELLSKLKAFGVSIRPGEYVDQIRNGEDDVFIVKSNRTEYVSRAVLMTTGLKAYYSPLVDYIQIQDWDGEEIYEGWPSLDELQGRRIAVLYGTPSLFQIPMELEDAIKSITIVCDENTVASHTIEIEDSGKIKIDTYRNPWRILRISGKGKPESLVLLNSQTGEEKDLKVDLVVGFYQGHSRQTIFSNWGLEMLGQQIKVDQRMQTSLSRIYAAGDIAWYPGKIKLLSAGIYEAKIAVRNVLKDIRKSKDAKEFKRRTDV